MPDNANPEEAKAPESGFWSPEFWRNTGVASVAAAVAVAVENNPSFVVWLASSAVLCFVVAGLHSRLQVWIRQRKVMVGMPLGLSAFAFVVFGVYLAAFGKTPDTSNVDEVARGNALAALQEAASLNASVSGLRGEVASAMRFQEEEKQRREAAEKAAEAEQRRRATIVKQLTEAYDNGVKLRSQLRNRNADTQTLLRESQDWFNNTSDLIDKLLGAAYSSQFRNLSLSATEASLALFDIPQERQGAYKNLGNRLELLDSFRASLR